MLDDGLFTRFPHPTHAIAFHDSASLPAGMIGYSPTARRWPMSIRSTSSCAASAATAPIRTRPATRSCSPAASSPPCRPWSAARSNPLDSAVVTVGSFHAGTKHNIISDEARLQLTVRSFTPEVRRQLLDGIARIARGEAIAAGVPEDRMPVVTVREAEFTPATVNTDGLTAEHRRPCSARHFGDGAGAARRRR